MEKQKAARAAETTEDSQALGRPPHAKADFFAGTDAEVRRQGGHMEKHTLGFDTLQVHAGQHPDSETHSRCVPIYQTAAYSFRDAADASALFALEKTGNIYSRLTNPTNDVLEQRMAALDGGVGALAMASGHAAIFNTILNLAGAGDEIVSSICIYGGAVNLLGVTLDRIGIRTKFVDPDDLQAWEDAVTDKTRAFFVEVVGNPNANLADLEKIAEIAHRHGVPLIVDSTVTTPYLIRPFAHGADIAVYSATKFLGGHGTSVGGIVVDSGNFSFLDNPRFPLYNQPDPSYHGAVFARDFGNAAFILRLRTCLLRDGGACLSPFNAFLILQGVETLSLRMRQHSANALAVAAFLEKQPEVKAVHYPGLAFSPYHALARKYLPKGAGAVFTCELAGGREAAVRFIDALRLFSIVANVGDVRSLVIHPGTTTHGQLSDAQLAQSGIAPGTVRFSIGIEDCEDLLGDLKQALAKSAL